MTAERISRQKRRAGWAGGVGRVLPCLAVIGAALLACVPARAQRAELISRTELRVCADPHNLPFSNQEREGFENKIAEIIGADLGLPATVRRGERQQHRAAAVGRRVDAVQGERYPDMSSIDA